MMPPALGSTRQHTNHGKTLYAWSSEAVSTRPVSNRLLGWGSAPSAVAGECVISMTGFFSHVAVMEQIFKLSVSHPVFYRLCKGTSQVHE